MAQLPYYGLNQGNLQMQSTQEVVDEYDGLREGINIAQKYAEQKEAIEANKILSQARSELSINMNKLQQETGLDAEGFTEKVNESLTDYENKIMESVPYSQRDKFTSNFAGIKYGLIEKAGAFEVTAATEKMKNDVNESVEYNANTILSDFTQRQVISEETAEMIDSLNLPESAKNDLKKASNKKYAVSEINALTNINPSALLSNLNNGVYDKDITSEIKAAAINQAKNKIKSNDNESKLMAKQQVESIYNQDMYDVMAGKINETQLKSDVLPKYIGMKKEYNALLDQFNKMQKEGLLLQQTAIDFQDGNLVGSDNVSQTRIDSLYDLQYKSAYEKALADEGERTGQSLMSLDSKTAFSIGKELANNSVAKSGYLPEKFSNTLISKWNSGNISEMEMAATAFYQAKQVNQNLSTSSTMSDNYKEKMMLVGTAVRSGYSAKEIIDMVKTPVDKATSDYRKSTLRTMRNKGKIKGSLDVDGGVVDAQFNNVFDRTFMQTGDADLSKKMGEDYINTNYGMNNIGAGVSDIWEVDRGDINLGHEDGTQKSYRVRGAVMYQPPIKMYSNPTLSTQENMNWMAEDLVDMVKISYPDASYVDIEIENNGVFSLDNRPVYDVYYKGTRMVSDNGSLQYWKPDYVEYRKRKGAKK